MTILAVVALVVLGPSALLASVCWIRPIMDRIRKLELQQPPAWIRYVMGLKFNPAKALLFAWIYGPVILAALAVQRVRSWFCRHDFSKSYGENMYGEPDLHCAKCFRWKDHPGFVE